MHSFSQQMNIPQMYQNLLEENYRLRMERDQFHADADRYKKIILARDARIDEMHDTISELKTDRRILHRRSTQLANALAQKELEAQKFHKINEQLAGEVEDANVRAAARV